MKTTDCKQAEIDIRQLVTQGRAKIYDIAKRCLSLLDESDDYAAAIGIKPDDVVSHLNGYLRDFAVDLEDCRILMKIFPARQQWDRPLLDLLKDAEKQIKAESKASRDDDEPQRTRKVVKQSEFEKIVHERDEAIAETANMQRQLAKMVAENDQLKSTVAELRGEVRVLREMRTATVSV